MHISTQGLVLRAVNYRESDKLLTVLTAEGASARSRPGAAAGRAVPWPPRPSSWSIRT